MTQAVPTETMQPDQYQLLPSGLIRLARKSRISGTHYMDLPITQDQLATYAHGRKLIQDCFPDCNAEQREFIQTGYTPEDWAKMFPKGDEE